MSPRRRSHRGASSRSLAGILAIVLLNLLVPAVAAELILRVTMPDWRDFYSGWFMESIKVPGEANTTIGRPGFDGWFAQNNGDFRVHIRINPFGLRNDEPVEAADGRIWVVGDSMSFGWGVAREQTYTAVLAERLGTGTYNVASPGTSVCSWHTLLRRMPKDVKPRAVVVGLTIENRLGVYDCAAQVKADNAPAPNEADRVDLLTVKMALTRHSALYNFFAVSLKRVDLIQTALERLGLVANPGAILLHGHDPSKAEDAIRTTAQELKVLRDILPAEVPVLVVLFPARFELRDQNPYFRTLREGEAEALAKLGIPALDLYPDFVKAGMGPTHFAHDGHWTALGHRIAGDAVAQWFAEHPLP